VRNASLSGKVRTAGSGKFGIEKRSRSRAKILDVAIELRLGTSSGRSLQIQEADNIVKAAVKIIGGDSQSIRTSAQTLFRAILFSVW